MSHDLIINTAHTLSINASPGEDKRFPNTSIESIFTFGDFRIHRDLTPHSLSANTGGISFGNYSTISSLSSATDVFNAHQVININENELNIKRDDPTSYVFYGSFYTKVASSINNIIENWPYAILSYDYGTGATIVNYTNNYNQTSTFSIPVSATTNQGDIIYASGYTTSQTASTILTLFNNYDQFEIELSSTTLHQSTHKIILYDHDTINSRLNFTIDGYLLSASTATTNVAVYIRPSLKRYYQYKKTVSDLEYQILFEEKFLVPNPDDDTFVRRSFSWPKTIDGFNPDIEGTDYKSYVTEILRACAAVDEIKTNWMVRTMIPENYLELDSDGQTYRKLINVYAEEFDKIKKYIDNLAYSHTVTYDNEESIPDKFLHRLSKLLGWEPINAFTDADIFEYLAKEDSDGYTKSDYNTDLWKKILISINWLYKKKGTRDALQFIFKLLGAPDALINFNEFVYKINQSVTGSTAQETSSKIRDTGFIEFGSSNFAFQEGGEGRGNGDAFINQWRPEFDPKREINNIKIQTGDTNFDGTANIVNTKEAEIELSPAAAIEYDLKAWYDLGYIHSSLSGSSEIPSYVNLNGVQQVIPSSISAMTIAQWMDYVYSNSLNPRNHKVEGAGHHTFFYKNLKDIYLTYYFWNSANQVSNRLNFRKLESFLSLIERNFSKYIYKLLPATTIIDRDGATYRNTIFNRQKFVYPPGINSGSEFQIRVPISSDLTINSNTVVSTINDIIHPEISAVNVVSSISDILNYTISAVEVNTGISTGINETINAVTVNSELQETNTTNKEVLPKFIGTISFFPPGGIPQAQPPIVPVPYQTRRNVTIPSSDSSSAEI